MPADLAVHARHQRMPRMVLGQAVVQRGQRCFQRMGKIADMFARARQHLAVLFDQRVDLMRDGAQAVGLQQRLEGGMHEVTNGFWSYENSHLLQPLYKANRQYESLTREYLSNIHIDELDSPALSARNRAK